MQIMKMVWKLQRLVNTGLEYPVISTSIQPLSATNFSYSLSQPLRFSIFQIQPVVLILAPQHEFCYLEKSLLILFLSLAFLDWLLFVLPRPFKCHIFRAAFPAVLTQISACSNVSSLTAWELHKDRGCETTIWAEFLSHSSVKCLLIWIEWGESSIPSRKWNLYQ